MCAPACLRVVCLHPCAGEDDGYLMVYVTKSDGTSYMHVYDAATMDATPVAEVSRGLRPLLQLSGIAMEQGQEQQLGPQQPRVCDSLGTCLAPAWLAAIA